MNCICYNIINNLQTQLSNLLMTAANNRLNTGASTTDDGAYRPNLDLLDNQNNSFDLNTFFYILLILITFFSFTSMINSRRRRIGGNGSNLN